MASEKYQLRAILKESRQALSQRSAATLSASVQSRLIESPFYRSAPAVVLYAAIDNEVATNVIAADSLRSGRVVYYPRIDRERRSISPTAIGDLSELEPGAFGIPEPPAGRQPEGRQIDPERLRAALVCVPGLAFSPAGARLGRGGGYYDRMLAQLGPGVIAAGLAYSFQLLDSIPETPQDRRLDFVVTEFAVHPGIKIKSASGLRIDRGGTPRCMSY